MSERLPVRPVIDMRTEPLYDEYGTMTIGEWGGYLVQILPMLFNNRLVLTPANATWGYDHGWCYPKGPAALLAALAWDPETEAEPAGYKKRATAGVREPGDKAPAGDRQWIGEALIGLLSETPTIACPSCGKTSAHPQDIENGYCGNCHAFTAPGATL